MTGPNVLIVNAFDAHAGSQRVAATLARSLAADGQSRVRVDLGFGTWGFLSELPMTRVWLGIDKPRYRRPLYPIWVIRQNVRNLLHVARGGHLWLNTVFAVPTAALALRVAPRRVVIHVHEVVFPGVLGRSMHRAIRRGAKAVCVSDHQRRQLGLDCAVLHNSVEPSDAAGAKDRLVFVGTVSAAKGFDLFTAVARALRDTDLRPIAFVPEIRDAESMRLVEDARAAGVEVRLGETQPGRMFEGAFLTLQATDSRLWIETFSLVAAESIAHRVPVATAGSEVVAEVAGEALAFDHPSRNAAAIARDIRALRADPKRYRLLVAACAERRNKFSVKAFYDGAMKIINSA